MDGNRNKATFIGLCSQQNICIYLLVSSIFSIEIKIFEQRKLKRSLNVNGAAVPPEVFIDVEEGELL